MRVGQIGHELDGSRCACQRVFVQSALIERRRQIAMGMSEIRLQRDGPSITLHSRVDLAQGPHEIAKAQMDGRGLGRRRQRLLQELPGAAAVALVQRDEADKMQNLAALRRFPQDPAINGFGLTEPACLVMSDPGFEVGHRRNSFRAIAARMR